MSDTLCVNTFSNLEEVLSPFYYGPEVPVPSVPPGTMAVPQGLSAQAKLAEDCQWAYTFNGPVIRCFPVSNTMNSFLLGRGHVPLVISTVGYHFPEAIIRCVVELSILNEVFEPGIRKLLLGLDCGSTGSLVIFDPVKGQPMRWITVHAPVESLVIMNHFDENGNSDPHFNEAFNAMVGVAGVGLAGGEFIVVDLGLDELRKDLHIAQSTFQKLFQRENTLTLTKIEHDDGLALLKRRNSIAHKTLIYVDFQSQDLYLREGFDNPDLFYYWDASGELIGTIRRQDVHITAMAYVPTIGSIIVGFNFGGFQIWSVDDLQLQYSSPFSPESIPVYSFEFQIPIDDPRNFCYIWALFGLKSLEPSETRVELNCLEYESVAFVNQKVIYRDLKTCLKKLVFKLQDCYHNPDESDDSLATSTDTLFRDMVRPLSMWTHPESLLFISWESCRDGVSYLGIFDLNQWYSAQTPNTVPMFHPSHFCSFWSAISIRNSGFYSGLSCIRIIPKTLQRWLNSHVENDIHAYPASITFQAMCLSASGTFIFEHFGIQEKFLRLIQKDGYNLMADPSTLRLISQKVGLTPYLKTIYPEDFSQKKIDQFYIMSIILECSRPALLVQMANRWLDGSFQNLDLSLDLILEWINSFTTVVRVAADRHWEVIMSTTIGEIPPETYRFLYYSNFIWNQHKALLWTLLRPLTLSDEELEDHYDLKFAIDKLVQYSSTLVLLHRAEILPVSPDGDFTQASKTYYAQRRETVQSALDGCPFLHPEERGGHTLLIDYLFENLEEEFICQEWDVEPGNPIYPPKHPGYIINLFLGNWIHISPKIISRIIFYYMLDVMQYEENRNDLKGDFNSIISLSPEEQWEVEILWMIDHGEFPEAISRLSRIQIDDEREGYPWSAALVILAAQGYEKPIFKILRNNIYPAKISKFSFNLAYELEPTDDILSGIILSFWYDRSTLFRLLEMAESRDSLDRLILRDICTHGEYIQEAVTEFLEHGPKTINNQLRLLKLYISTENLNLAVKLYKEMFLEWKDRRFLREIDREEFENVEVSLKRLMLLKQDRFGFTHIGDQNTKSLRLGRKISIISEESNLSERLVRSPDLNLVPPQLRRLMKDGMEVRAGLTALSPLKRYSGRLHRVVELESPSAVIPIHKLYTTTSLPMSPKASSFNPFRQNLNIRKELELSDSSCDCNSKSEVNLQQLLRTPSVTPTASTGNESSDVCTTPVSSTSNDSPKKLYKNKSIMKKKERSLRNALLRTRFLDLSTGSVELDTATADSSELVTVVGAGNFVNFVEIGESDESPELVTDSPQSGDTLPFSPDYNPPSDLEKVIFEISSDEEKREKSMSIVALNTENLPGAIVTDEEGTGKILSSDEEILPWGTVSNTEKIDNFLLSLELNRRNLLGTVVSLNQEEKIVNIPSSTVELNIEALGGVVGYDEDVTGLLFSNVIVETENLTQPVSTNEEEIGMNLFKSFEDLNTKSLGDTTSNITDQEGIDMSLTDVELNIDTLEQIVINEEEIIVKNPSSVVELSTETTLQSVIMGTEEEKTEKTIFVDEGNTTGICEFDTSESHVITKSRRPRQKAMSETRELIPVSVDTKYPRTRRSSASQAIESIVLTPLDTSISRRGKKKSVSEKSSELDSLSNVSFVDTSILDSSTVKEPTQGIIRKSSRKNTCSIDDAETSSIAERDESEERVPKPRRPLRKASSETREIVTIQAEVKQHRTRRSSASQAHELTLSPLDTSIIRQRKRKSITEKKLVQLLDSSDNASFTDVSISDISILDDKKSKGKSRKKSALINSSSIDSSILDISKDEDLTTSRRKSTRKSTSSDDGDTSTTSGRGETGRAQSEEPPTKVGRGRRKRKSLSEPRELDISGNQSFYSTGDSDEDMSIEDTSIQDTSFNEPRRRGFDFIPSLSTVLEVSEYSTPGNTSFMTPRRRSLRQASRTSLNDSIMEESTTPSISGDSKVDKFVYKRKRSSRLNSSIGSIEEEEDVEVKEPQRRRVRRSPVQDDESDSSIRSGSSNTSGRSKTTTTTTRTTSRKK